MKFFIVACCLILTGVCGDARAQLNAYGTAARVNGVDISNEMLERNFEEYQRDKDVNIAAIRYPKRVNTMRREVLDQLIDQEILWQAAREADLLAGAEEIDVAMQEVRSQFSSEQDFLARLATEGYSLKDYREHLHKLLSARKYMASVAADIKIRDEDIHDFYVANPAKFQLPEAVRARHILLTLMQTSDKETRDAVFERAGLVLERLLAGEAFADVAIEVSQDSSASAGGDLGYFPRGKMVRSFEDAAFALQVGETSGIVETPFGLHIIKLEDRQAAQTVSEDMAKEKITQHLVQVEGQRRIGEKMAALRAAAAIEVLAAQ